MVYQLLSSGEGKPEIIVSVRTKISLRNALVFFSGSVPSRGKMLEDCCKIKQDVTTAKAEGVVKRKRERKGRKMGRRCLAVSISAVLYTGFLDS